MATKQEWTMIQEATAVPHFKYLLKRRTMDTSNWVRLKKGYDRLDATDDAPIICWEKIGPERVMPLLTFAPKESSNKLRGSSSSRRPFLRRQKHTEQSMEPPEKTKTERPINAFTVDEITQTMYVPKLKMLPKAANKHIFAFTKAGDDRKAGQSQPNNPYREFYLFRNLTDDPTIMWVRALWKIARECCLWFDTLSTGSPKITDSFMVNLLASGCDIKEISQIRLQQLEDIGTDMQPLVFERSIDYGYNAIVDAETRRKPLTKRQRAFAYGRWYYPIKLWGTFEEVMETVKKRQGSRNEEALVHHPRFKNYYNFIKDKGYRIPQVLYTTLEGHTKR